MSKTIYLDHAAATPLDKKVLSAMLPYYSEHFHNPSALYQEAKNMQRDIEQARTTVAQILGSKKSEIIFTAGGTEANNLALIGVAQAFAGAHFVTSAIEHESIRAPLEFMTGFGWTYSEVAPKPDGVIDPLQIVKSIKDNTVLVSVMYANNEIGSIQPIRQIAKQIADIRSKRLENGNKMPLYLHTDACQAANYLDLNVHRLGVDLMTLNGGKIYGPKQSGCLYVAAHTKIEPLIHGGGQERKLRSGTENVANIIGFASALKTTQDIRQEETTRLQKLQQYFIKELADDMPEIFVNGSLKSRLPNNVHITIPNSDNERLIFGLDELGVQCSAGSACSASDETPSHVLRAIGLSDEDARSSLRFSMGRRTSLQDIKTVVDLLVKLVD